VGGRQDPVTFGSAELIHSGRRLLGCRHGNADPDRDVPLLLRWLRNGDLDLRSLITHRISLDEIGTALARPATGLRTIVTF